MIYLGGNKWEFGCSKFWHRSRKFGAVFLLLLPLQVRVRISSGTHCKGQTTGGQAVGREVRSSSLLTMRSVCTYPLIGHWKLPAHRLVRLQAACQMECRVGGCDPDRPTRQGQGSPVGGALGGGGSEGLVLGVVWSQVTGGVANIMSPPLLRPWWHGWGHGPDSPHQPRAPGP